MSERHVHVTIGGRVQGVGFRAWVQQEALARGLGGWVRNRRDGSVEAVFAGPDEAVTAMLVACRKGPPSAVVAEIAIDDDPGALPASPFQVRPTA